MEKQHRSKIVKNTYVSIFLGAALLEKMRLQFWNWRISNDFQVQSQLRM